MKTPEDKAKELIEKFKKVGCRSFEEAEDNSAKQCALICVEEMLEWEICPPFARSDNYKYWEMVKNNLI